MTMTKVPIALALALVSLVAPRRHRPMAALPRLAGRPRRRTTPRCPTPGARPRTSSGRPTSPGSAGARPSSGTITSSSPRRSARGKEATPIPGLYDPGDDQGSVKSSAVQPLDGLRRRLRHRQDPLGHASCATGRRRLRGTSRTPSRRRPPVTDGERVYVHFGTIGLLAALDMNGQIALGARARRLQGQLGVRDRPARPSLHNGRLYLVNDNTSSRSSPRSTRAPARRSGEPTATRSAELGDAVCLGERRCGPRS